jgi:hypothetical protein
MAKSRSAQTTSGAAAAAAILLLSRFTPLQTVLRPAAAARANKAEGRSGDAGR